MACSLLRLARCGSSLLLILSFQTAVYAQEMDRAFMEKMKAMRFWSQDPDEAIHGSWKTVIPKDDGAAIGRILGMQTVHTVLLPSGKILLASGSSWRNPNTVQTYPQYSDPCPGQGLFIRDEDPFRMDKLTNYYRLVNNTALYDPDKNTFYRIPSPVPVADPDHGGRFAPNDMFCTGHMQLPNGNPLFVGGTQYYFPYRTGARTSYIFDWRKELGIDWTRVDWRKFPSLLNNPWTFSGFMKRGRWYPTIVPLVDGRFVIFSGFVGFDRGYEPMYRFEINHYVEIFNPDRFTPQDPSLAWEFINVKDSPNSPFNTKLVLDPFFPTPCVDMEFWDDWGLDPKAEGFTSPCDCPPRCVEDLKKDAFRLYPNNYLLGKNQIYLSREGEWVSLRTPDTEYMRRTRFTYWMNVKGTMDDPEVSFEMGPLRPDIATSYGTSFNDPNCRRVTILGGQPISAGTLFPIDAVSKNHFAGGRGSRKIEQFFHHPGEPLKDYWTEEDDFLGNQPQDDRTMHTAIILPTRQILIINGGNFDFYGPVYHPILLTPEFNSQGRFLQYKKERMAEAVEPRLYHNSAVLLPDGRVWVSGGNTARASVSMTPLREMPTRSAGQPKPNLNEVDIDLYFFTDGQMAKGQKGMLTTPTEDWVAEIFSPPYLHIDSDRTAAIVAMETKDQQGRVTFRSEIGGDVFYLLQSGGTYDVKLAGLPSARHTGKEALRLLKLPSFTHGWDSGQRLIELDPREVDGKADHLRFQMPNAAEQNITPGYYMLFYIDAHGKPSRAQMVRIDDRAVKP